MLLGRFTSSFLIRELSFRYRSFFKNGSQWNIFFRTTDLLMYKNGRSAAAKPGTTIYPWHLLCAFELAQTLCEVLTSIMCMGRRGLTPPLTPFFLVFSSKLEFTDISNLRFWYYKKMNLRGHFWFPSPNNTFLIGFWIWWQFGLKTSQFFSAVFCWDDFLIAILVCNNFHILNCAF